MFCLGVYSPLTIEGKIIVDGVLTSCYAGFHHDLAHLTMTPMHRLSRVMKWLFGNDTGLNVFVNTAKELGILLLPMEHLWHY